MSGPLAIAAVSTGLRNILESGVSDAGAVSALGAFINVTAVAPDTINLGDPALGPQLNLFLYQVTPNAGWRNVGLPSRNGAGERITNPPLALDLHYLLTAYARESVQAEMLLGYAMQILHERPYLDRATISALPALLAASDLADQVEAIKITPAAMGAEELSKLWTAIQSHYRPSVGYHVSVILIEAKQSALNPLPVLSRGVTVRHDLLPPFPTLLIASPPKDQISVKLGETISLEGARLTSTTNVVAHLTHRLVPDPLERPVTVEPGGKSASFTLPVDGTAEFPAGSWLVSLLVTPPVEAPAIPVLRETNAVGFAIAPEPELAPLSVNRNGDRVEVQIKARPDVRPPQLAELAIGGVTAIAAPRTLVADPLIFTFPPSLPADPGQRVRLRVDGVDSRLVDRPKDMPPTFDFSQVITV